MRRYAAVQKARDASVIALLVGTLGVAAYLPLLAHLREKLVERGRRIYTISVGKLTPAKLANYAEIDVFVLLACPENSLVDAIDATRSRDFFKPIVSPFEMLHALKDEEDGGREWSGDYVLDLDRLAPTPQTAAPSTSDAQNVSDELAAQTGDLSLTAQGSVEPTAPADGEESSDEEPQFSLITGGYVSRPKRAGKNGSGVRQIADAASAGVVMVRSADGSLTRVLDSAAGAHLAQRSWRGLETRSSDDAPSVLGRGRAGIASGYADSGGTSEGQEGVGAITREQTQAGQQ
jgi:diphthamide biosynthesis protein 2